MLEGNGLDIVGLLRGGWDVNGMIMKRGCYLVSAVIV
jgi:hypothetical protein